MRQEAERGMARHGCHMSREPVVMRGSNLAGIHKDSRLPSLRRKNARERMSLSFRVVAMLRYIENR